MTMYLELLEFLAAFLESVRQLGAVWIQERHRKNREIIWLNIRTTGMGKQWLSDEKIQGLEAE